MTDPIKIFNYTSYKKFLADWIKHVGGRGSLSKIAHAASCHRTYLSQVLNSKVELTLDHAAALIPFFHFSDEEADYFLTCVSYQRSAQTNSKNYFLKKLNIMSRQYQTVTSRIATKKSPGIEADGANGFYYASTLTAAVHIATSCSQLQTVPALAKYFDCNEAKIESILEILVRSGMVSTIGNRHVHSGKILHLDRNSPFNRINHLNWRLAASENSYDTDSIHYTNVFSISKNDWSHIKSTLLDFIESQNKKIHSSGAEDVYTFCCDLFPAFKR